jgi:hypothetical protein
MSQLRHLYLPQLSSDADIGDPEHPGAWKDNDRKVLRGISKGIEVSQQAKNVCGVSSVPDIWARPLMFQTAIRPESGHPLREQMVKEWRGLLSLLALRRIHDYDVEIVPVTLDQRTFSEALRNLKPTDVQLEPDQTYSWTDVLMIRYENIPVGAFSPSTLVYTAVDYQEQLRDLPLNLQQRDSDGHKTGHLGPPTHPKEKKYVGEWVYGLHDRLSSLLNQNSGKQRGSSVSAVLNELFSNWLSDIRSDLNLGPDEIDATDVKVADDYTDPIERWSPLDDYQVYQELLRPLEIDWEALSEGDNSDLALDPARNESDYEEIVVLTPQLMQQDVRIWLITRLDQLGGDAHEALARDFDAPKGDFIGRTNLSEFNSCWVRPERYFLTDVLVKAPDNEPLFPEGERALNEGGRFLLPFKKEILDFFSPREIQEQLAPEFEDTSDGVTFSFSLPLVGGRTADVEKTYRFKNARATEGRIAETPMPVLELFPNYLGENWRRYYLFQGDLDAVTAAPVLHGDGTAITRDHEARINEERRTVRTTEMRGDDAFPEGVAFEETGSGTSFGLLLIDVDTSGTDRLTGPDGWTVGIDFGTSNTTIFRSGEETQKWEVELSKYFRSLTASPDPARDDLLEHHFLPDADVELPFPTYMRLLRGSDEKKLLLDYFAFFSSSYQVPDYVETNIKWEGNPDYIEHFVESLLLLVLLETTDKDVKELKISCSYPESFSDDVKSMFKQAWKGKLEGLTNGEGRVLSIYKKEEDEGKKVVITDDGTITKRDIAFEKEGHAAGEFFGSGKIIDDPSDEADKEGAVILDVGGGTTDISIWYDGEIVHSASVLLAGRQIAEYLKDNTQLRGLLFDKDAAIALEEGARKSGVRFAPRLNSVLRDQGDNVQRLVAKHGTRDEVRRLRQIIALEFGALAYYTAALVGAAERTPEGKGILDWISNEGIEFKLHWGGNGAKLLSWVDHGGSYKKDGVAAKVLTAIAFNALQNLDNLQISSDRLGQVMSPDHKSEAAGGLSVMQLGKYAEQGVGDSGSVDPMAMPGDVGEAENDAPEKHSDDSASDGVVCGEAIQLTSGAVGFTDIISNDVLFDEDRTTYESTDLEHFSQFVEMINYFGTNFGLFSESMKIELSDGDERTIAKKVRTSFNEARSLSHEERVIEPVFIMEVKALLSMIRSGGR